MHRTTPITDVAHPPKPLRLRRVSRKVITTVTQPTDTATGVATNTATTNDKVAWIREVGVIKQRPKSVQPQQAARPKAIDAVHRRRKPLNAKNVHKRTMRSKTLRRTMPHPLKPNSTTVKPSQPVIADITPAKKTRRQKIKLFMLPLTAVLLFAVGVGFLWQSQKKTAFVKEATEQVAAATDEGGSTGGRRGPDADETPPPAVSSYQVAPNMPKVLRIPSLGVESRITPMGILPSGELKAPYNIYDTGWYDQSSKPGKHGAMLLDGHVHGPTQPGVFFKLKDIKDGATVEVERGDGKIFKYKVVGRDLTEKSKTNMNKALVSAKRGTPGLNLITCTGSYNTAGEYEERLVVYTILQ